MDTLQVNKLLPGGQGLAPALLARAAALVLDWHARNRSRFAATDSEGRALAVVLPRGRALRGGDALVAGDGSVIRIDAAAQPVLQVRAAGMFALMRAAYHLGNRHVALELQPALLQLEPDPVLETMLRAMGLDVRSADAPFEPEAGAYAVHEADPSHAHPHSHGH